MTSKFGRVNKFNIKEDTGYFEALKLVYTEESKGSGKVGKVCAAAKSAPYATANYAYHHPYKVAATMLVVAAVALTAAYFLSPAYAAFVGKTATGITGLATGAATTVAGWHAAAVTGLGNAIPFIGTDIGAKMLVGAVMLAVAAGIAYGLYKGAEKVYTYLTGPEVAPINTQRHIDYSSELGA